MTPEQVKEKLEGVKWINKEIKGLYLELEANTKPQQGANEQREQDRKQPYKCSEAKRGYTPEN